MALNPRLRRQFSVPSSQFSVPSSQFFVRPRPPFGRPVAQKVIARTTRPGPRAKPRRRRRWIFILALVCGIPAVILSAILGYYYVVFARLVDERLHGERDRVLPRVYARPFELRRGQALTEQQLIEQLTGSGSGWKRRRSNSGRRARLE